MSEEKDNSVKIERKKLADYVQNPNNPVAHDPRNLGVVVDSIHKVGAFRSGAASKGKILAGNLTWEAMAEAGIEDVIEVTTDGKTWVIVNREDLTTDQEREAAYYDQRGAELASWEADQILLDVEGGVDLTGIFTSKELDELLADVRSEEPPEDPGARISEADKLQEKWQTALGQVWELGAHRLACGDCTDPQVVEAVMRGGKALLMTTDPPYGVMVDHSWRDGIKNRSPSPRGGHIVGDSRCDWHEIYPLFDAQIVYVWHAAMFSDIVKAGLEEAGYCVRQQIIWVKSVHALSRSDYHWKHEPCWYAIKKGHNSNWHGDRSQMSVWEAPSPIIATSHDDTATPHPTQKPLLVFTKPIENNTEIGDIVCDPFVGSGTTIIACEHLNRKCRAIEIEPKYCAVSIQRWTDLTQKEPTLLTR